MIWPEPKTFKGFHHVNKTRLHEFFKIDGDPYESPDDDFTLAYKAS